MLPGKPLEGIEIGIKYGRINALGYYLPHDHDTRIIDAEGGYVTPGGIDSHVHLAQGNSPTGDGWETGSRSAIAGGTTTIIAFASQAREQTSLFPVLKDYHKKSDKQSYCDYGFHFILTNPTKGILENELAHFAREEGITSVKLYMTYEAMKLNDRQLLDVMMACRKLGMTTMIHSENSDMINLIIERLEQFGRTDPYYHAIARPRIAEDEASYRAISLAELVDAPILLVHMSSETAVSHVRNAQTRLLPIHAETCPHYLFLLSSALDPQDQHDHFAGAKHVCSPPLRHHPEDLEALWQGIANGTFTVFSSDHAPSKYDHPQGKKLGLVDGIPRFAKIPNGLPGLETRMALLFSQTDACQPPEKARLSVSQFVQLTSSNAAKMYGLKKKGRIAPGYEADLVIWYPPGKGETVIKQDMLHHGVDYTPFEGMKVMNWPRYTILRGEVVWDRDGGGVVGKKGYGEYVKREKGQLVVGRTGNLARGMKDGERALWMPESESQGQVEVPQDMWPSKVIRGEMPFRD